MDTLYIHKSNGVCNITTDIKSFYAHYNKNSAPLNFEEVKFKTRKYDSRISYAHVPKNSMGNL